MVATFMKSENSKTFDPYRLLCNVTDKIDFPHTTTQSYR